MQKLNDLSRCLTGLEPDGTPIAVIAMSQSSWLVAGIVPGVERQPLKNLKVYESTLLNLPHRWRQEAEKAGHRIKRISVAFEAGRDGFWLARWLSPQAGIAGQRGDRMSISGHEFPHPDTDAGHLPSRTS